MRDTQSRKQLEDYNYMNQHLIAFYNNQGQRETVKLFLIEVLKEIAVEKSFEGEPVTGIKEAKDTIDKAFDKL
jgi:hypothetical protein